MPSPPDQPSAQDYLESPTVHQDPGRSGDGPDVPESANRRDANSMDGDPYQQSTPPMDHVNPNFRGQVRNLEPLCRRPQMPICQGEVRNGQTGPHMAYDGTDEDLEIEDSDETESPWRQSASSRRDTRLTGRRHRRQLHGQADHRRQGRLGQTRMGHGYGQGQFVKDCDATQHGLNDQKTQVPRAQ
jgi:hypothetical protein